jgi:hypothetical protein
VLWAIKHYPKKTPLKGDGQRTSNQRQKPPQPKCYCRAARARGAAIRSKQLFLAWLPTFGSVNARARAVAALGRTLDSLDKGMRKNADGSVDI